jgi:hypothetical protein
MKSKILLGLPLLLTTIVVAHAQSVRVSPDNFVRVETDMISARPLNRQAGKRSKWNPM